MALRLLCIIVVHRELAACFAMRVCHPVAFYSMPHAVSFMVKPAAHGRSEERRVLNGISAGNMYPVG